MPLFLLATVLFMALAAETLQLVDEQSWLSDLRAVQAQQIQQVVKFRQQLQLLAGGTARLADGGDAAAKRVVEAMHQQGGIPKAGCQLVSRRVDAERG